MFPEARFRVSSGLDELASCSVVGVFGLGRGQVLDALVGPLGVEPVDVVQGLQFHVLEPAPGPLRFDELSLVEPDLGLCQRIVVGLTG